MALPKPLDEFIISVGTLNRNDTLKKVYESYIKQREARRSAEAKEDDAKEALVNVLDNAVRAHPKFQGEAWTFDANDKGLKVACWDKPKQKGKRKVEVIEDDIDLALITPFKRQ